MFDVKINESEMIKLFTNQESELISHASIKYRNTHKIDVFEMRAHARTRSCKPFLYQNPWLWA